MTAMSFRERSYGAEGNPPILHKKELLLSPDNPSRPLFEVATTREGSDVALINEPPLANNEPEAADSCFWWRRGRVELPVQKNPWSDILQACPAIYFSHPGASADRISETPAD